MGRFLWLVCLILLPCPALAERWALAFGINDYAELPHLAKAVNDATAVAATLEGMGFTVTLAANPGRREMTKALSDLSAQVQAGDTVLFYFAGHGIEIAGRNYLLPADAPLVHADEEAFLTAESVAVDEVLATLQARGAGVTVLVLDACRDNPFAAQGTRGVGSAGGLAPQTAPEGSFILFSAGTGQTALDNLGPQDADPNSVFTRALLPLLSQADLALPDLARKVRVSVEDVAGRVGHKQRPAYYDELTGDFSLAAPEETAKAPSTGVNPCDKAAADWAPVSGLGDPAALRAFAEAHAGCAPLSRAALTEAERLEAARPAAKPEKTWRVRDGVSDGYVNIRKGPGTMHARLPRPIPAGTGGLSVTDCRPADPGGGAFDWCRVTWQGESGWVSINGLEAE